MINKLEKLMKEAETMPSVGANTKELEEKYGLYGYVRSKKIRTKSRGTTYYVAYFLCDSDTKKVMTGVVFTISKGGQRYNIIAETKTVLYGAKQLKDWEERCEKRW